MDWQSLVKANAAIRTTNIKGKEYAEVNQRVKAFRTLYPEGFITTEILCREGGLCIIKATVGHYADGKSVILATGTAYEKEGSSQINRTSYIENCETSAVGRALGMAGFGIDTSIASADEINNALLQQNTNAVQKPATPKEPAKQPSRADQLAELERLLTETNTDRQKFFGYYKVENADTMDADQLAEGLQILRRRTAKKANMEE